MRSRFLRTVGGHCKDLLGSLPLGGRWRWSGVGALHSTLIWEERIKEKTDTVQKSFARGVRWGAAQGNEKGLPTCQEQQVMGKRLPD